MTHGAKNKERKQKTRGVEMGERKRRAEDGI